MGVHRVNASVSRGGPGTGQGRSLIPFSNALRRIGAHDMVVVNLAKDSVIHYNRGKVACKRCGEPRMPTALNEEGECRSINVCLKYQHQEVEMASTLPVDWRHDNSVPPHSNEDVARVMRDEGVSRRGAYRLLKERRAAEVDVSGVSEGQRVAVLGVLINDHESRKDVHTLIEECHAIGIKIDGHDVTKTLFALQHQGFVRFRERNRPRTLYAIVVTHAGHDAWLKRDQNHNFLADDNELLPGPVMSTVELAEISIVPTDAAPGQMDAGVIAGARALQQEINALGAGPVPFAEARGKAERDAAREAEDMIKRPWVKGNLGGWPSFREVRNRALRARKLNAAAVMLQEAGGYDDAVLTIMAETEITPLEGEVKQLLELFGEIE